jgi:cytochrome oxidase Cu insertion factor (SCO1/SenC/PrrC family)
MSAPSPLPATRPRINPWTIWVPIIIIVCGLVIFWSYLFKLQQERVLPRLPILSRLEKNFTFTERSGKPAELKDLKGKIIVACWVYTHCPRGCSGVVGELLALHEELKDNPDVHFLSVSVDPEDSPEQLSKFADGLGIKGDTWWFVNGPMKDVRSYMTRYFGFMAVQDIPEKDRLTPQDKYMHDMKVALVDHQGHVRGMYDVGSPDPEFKAFWKEKIRTDIATLLKDKAEAEGR